jgi:hypothetical protein
MEQEFGRVAFGEVLFAAFTGPGKAAELEVDGAGRATYTMSGQDRGAVTNAGTTLTFLSASSGKSSTVQVSVAGPSQGLGSPNGQFFSDLTWHFLSPQRSEMIWLGNIPGGAAQALLRYATPDAPGQISMSRELKIFGSNGNQYELSVRQVAKGEFRTQSDQWTLTPDGAPAAHGTFRFEDKDTVTASSDEGTITWKRVN